MHRDPRYPLGPFTFAGPATPDERALWIARIAEAPARLRAAVAGLDDEQLETHPEHPAGMTLEKLLALSAWHGHHHVAQIEHLLERRGWARDS